jgi:hypothetical protein
MKNPKDKISCVYHWHEKQFNEQIKIYREVYVCTHLFRFDKHLAILIEVVYNLFLLECISIDKYTFKHTINICMCVWTLVIKK